MVVFALAYLILLERRSWQSFGLSMLAYTAAAFTSGNGPFLVLIGMLLLGIQRRRSPMAIHLAVAAVVFYGYFSGYTTPLHDIIEQHNEHRIVFTRAVVLLDYYVFGAVNFRHLLFVGNFAVVLVVGLLGLVFRPQSKWKLLLFLPVPLLMLQPQSLKNMFYPMASL